MKTKLDKTDLDALWEQGAAAVSAMPESLLIWHYDGQELPLTDIVLAAHDEGDPDPATAVGITEQGQIDWGEGFRDVFATYGGPAAVRRVEDAWNASSLAAPLNIEYPWDCNCPPCLYVDDDDTCLADAGMRWADMCIRWGKEHGVL